MRSVYSLPSLSFQFGFFSPRDLFKELGRVVLFVFTYLWSASQNKSDVQEKEAKRFDGAGYDKDLVEALERDIISQNPNIKW